MVSVEDIMNCILDTAEEIAEFDKDAAEKLTTHGCKWAKLCDISGGIEDNIDLPFVFNAHILNYMEKVEVNFNLFFSPIRAKEGYVYWDKVLLQLAKKRAKAHVEKLVRKQRW